jgi:hypothetical protein
MKLDTDLCFVSWDSIEPGRSRAKPQSPYLKVILSWESIEGEPPARVSYRFSLTVKKDFCSPKRLSETVIEDGPYNTNANLCLKRVARKVMKAAE